MTRLLLPAGFLLLAGLTILSSIATNLFVSQAIWCVIGIGAIAIASRIDWGLLQGHKNMLWAFYFITVLLIALAVLVGPEIRNTRNWLAIGPIRIQPVELAKLALILLYASFWSTRHIAVARWRTILLSLVICLIPTVLTLMQPDLGSASVLCAIWFGYLLASGLPKGRIFVGAVVAEVCFWCLLAHCGTCAMFCFNFFCN
jgi:cell division protein FtsW (lipid II flippase)